MLQATEGEGPSSKRTGGRSFRLKPLSAQQGLSSPQLPTLDALVEVAESTGGGVTSPHHNRQHSEEQASRIGNKLIPAGLASGLSGLTQGFKDVLRAASRSSKELAGGGTTGSGGVTARVRPNSEAAAQSMGGAPLQAGAFTLGQHTGLLGRHSRGSRTSPSCISYPEHSMQMPVVQPVIQPHGAGAAGAGSGGHASPDAGAVTWGSGRGMTHPVSRPAVQRLTSASEHAAVGGGSNAPREQQQLQLQPLRPHVRGVAAGGFVSSTSTGGSAAPSPSVPAGAQGVTGGPSWFARRLVSHHPVSAWEKATSATLMGPRPVSSPATPTVWPPASSSPGAVPQPRERPLSASAAMLQGAEACGLDISFDAGVAPAPGPGPWPGHNSSSVQPGAQPRGASQGIGGGGMPQQQVGGSVTGGTGQLAQPPQQQTRLQQEIGLPQLPRLASTANNQVPAAGRSGPGQQQGPLWQGVQGTPRGPGGILIGGQSLPAAAMQQPGGFTRESAGQATVGGVPHVGPPFAGSGSGGASQVKVAAAHVPTDRAGHVMQLDLVQPRTRAQVEWPPREASSIISMMSERASSEQTDVVAPVAYGPADVVGGGSGLYVPRGVQPGSGAAGLSPVAGVEGPGPGAAYVASGAVVPGAVGAGAGAGSGAGQHGGDGRCPVASSQQAGGHPGAGGGVVVASASYPPSDVSSRPSADKPWGSDVQWMVVGPGSTASRSTPSEWQGSRQTSNHSRGG